MTLYGTDTVSNYRTALQSVLYVNLSSTPSTQTRTVNDGTNTVSTSETVTVIASHQPPLVQVNDPTALTYKVNASPIAIMNLALVSDPDSNNLSSLTVQITSGYQTGHDILSFVNQLGITGSFNATTGTLTLSGLSYVGNDRQALRAVMLTRRELE